MSSTSLPICHRDHGDEIQTRETAKNRQAKNGGAEGGS